MKQKLLLALAALLLPVLFLVVYRNQLQFHTDPPEFGQGMGDWYTDPKVGLYFKIPPRVDEDPVDLYRTPADPAIDQAVVSSKAYMSEEQARACLVHGVLVRLAAGRWDDAQGLFWDMRKAGHETDFYLSFQDPGIEEDMPLLAEWMKARPESLLPVIAITAFKNAQVVDAAKGLRPSEYEARRKGWFVASDARIRAGLAFLPLDGNAGLWHRTWQIDLDNLGDTHADEVDKLYQDGVRQDARFLPLHVAMTAWDLYHGAPDKAAALLEQVAGTDDATYAECIVQLSRLTGRRIFEGGTLSWPRTRRGLLLLLEEHPDSARLLNRFCLLAIAAGDYGTARGLCDVIGPDPTSDVWSLLPIFQRARAEALANCKGPVPDDIQQASHKWNAHAVFPAWLPGPVESIQQPVATAFRILFMRRRMADIDAILLGFRKTPGWVVREQGALEGERGLLGLCKSPPATNYFISIGQKWQKAVPSSFGALITTAFFMHANAWWAHASGPGLPAMLNSSEPIEAARQETVHRLEDMVPLARRAHEMAPADPMPYLLLMEYEGAKAQDRGAYEALFKSAVKLNKDYLPFYIDKAAALCGPVEVDEGTDWSDDISRTEPQWPGKPGQVEAFADTAWKMSGDPRAYLAVTIEALWRKGDALFDKTRFKWSRIKGIVHQIHGSPPPEVVRPAGDAHDFPEAARLMQDPHFVGNQPPYYMVPSQLIQLIHLGVTANQPLAAHIVAVGQYETMQAPGKPANYLMAQYLVQQSDALPLDTTTMEGAMVDIDGSPNDTVSMVDDVVGQGQSGHDMGDSPARPVRLGPDGHARQWIGWTFDPPDVQWGPHSYQVIVKIDGKPLAQHLVHTVPAPR